MEIKRITCCLISILLITCKKDVTWNKSAQMLSQKTQHLHCLSMQNGVIFYILELNQIEKRSKSLRMK